MARKEDAKRKVQKKLSLNRETIRDLTPGKDTTTAVRAGARAQTENNTCVFPSTLPTRC